MGDVDGCKINIAWMLTPRTASSMKVYVRDNEVNGTKEFILSSDAKVYGFQMSLQASGLELIEGALPVSGSNLVVDQQVYFTVKLGATGTIVT